MWPFDVADGGAGFEPGADAVPGAGGRAERENDGLFGERLAATEARESPTSRALTYGRTGRRVRSSVRTCP